MEDDKIKAEIKSIENKIYELLNHKCYKYKDKIEGIFYDIDRSKILDDSCKNFLFKELEGAEEEADLNSAVSFVMSVIDELLKIISKLFRSEMSLNDGLKALEDLKKRLDERVEKEKKEKKESKQTLTKKLLSEKKEGQPKFEKQPHEQAPLL